MITALIIACCTFGISESIKEQNKLNLFGYICYALAQFIDAFNLFNIELGFKVNAMILSLEIVGTLLLLINLILSWKKTQQKGKEKMVVIYAEKGSLAQEIATALNAGERHYLKDEAQVGWYEFFFNGEEAIICHGAGHLAELVSAKAYDKKYEKWEIDVFPCIPDEFKISAKTETLKCLNLINSFFYKADWLINATDADREGELIFSYVREICNCHKPYKRVWLDDLTDEKIRIAFDNLKSPEEQLVPTETGNAHSLELAGRARAISDWLIGINLTVVATKKFGQRVRTKNTLLTIGRVLTPTLNMLVERERNILDFKRTTFWKLSATFSFSDKLFEAKYENGTFSSKTEAKNALSQCIWKKGIVSSIETMHLTEAAPLLFSTTQLQIWASRSLDWTSDKTAKILQALYEKKYISYPRTKSHHLTEAMIPDIKETIDKLFRNPEFEKFRIYEFADFTKRHFDRNKVSSHTAQTAERITQPFLHLNQLETLEKEVDSLTEQIYKKQQFNEKSETVADKNEVLNKEDNINLSDFDDSDYMTM